MRGPVGPRGWEEGDLVKIVNASPLWTTYRTKLDVAYVARSLLGHRGRAVRLRDIATLVCDGQAVICVELLRPVERELHRDGGATDMLKQILVAPSALERIDDAVEWLASLDAG